MTQDQHFKEAKNYMVGGVSAGGRVHPALKRALFLERADGCRLYDIDGNEWIDYHSSSGAAFLGYNHPAIKSALEQALEMGFFLNFETPYHKELAALKQYALQTAVPKPPLPPCGWRAPIPENPKY